MATQHEPIELLHAVRAHAGKITVFSQVGEIALPPSRRVFAFLERSVVPVRAPLGGVVHPKVWVLRYEALEASRTNARASAPRAHRQPQPDVRRELGHGGATRRGSGRQRRATWRRSATCSRACWPTADASRSRRPRRPRRSLAAALRSARFALPPGVDELHVHVLGLDAHAVAAAGRRGPVADHLAVRQRRLLPQRAPAPVDELVSRPESLDLLAPSTLADVGTAYAFDDGSAADLGAAEERLSPRDPGRPLVGLHAKVFAFEEGGRARAVPRLGERHRRRVRQQRRDPGRARRAGRERLGIDRLCDGTADEPGLRSLFSTYTRPEPAADDEPDGRALDAARRAIARLAIEGFVEESGEGWAVTYRSPSRCPAVDGATIHCWPLASPGNRRRVQRASPSTSASRRLSRRSAASSRSRSPTTRRR